MPTMRPSRRNAMGGASGETPTRRTGPLLCGPTCVEPVPHPTAATTARTAAARTTLLPITLAPSTPSLERDLDALGRRLGLDALARRVQRDAHAIAVLHAGDALAAADRSARLDGRVGSREITDRLHVVDIADGLALGRSDGIHGQAIDLERVGPALEQERATSPLVADAKRHRLL